MAAHNKLTQKQIEAAKADGKQSKLADGGGLYLLLHPNGSKYWRMRYRHGGCEKTLALGVYPAVSLKQARELARAVRAQTAAGIDPVAERRRTRPGSGRSLPEIARAWYGSRQGQRADNTLEGDRRSLAYLTDYYKDNTDINDITTAGVSKFIEHLNRINIPACARRTVQILAQIWDYAVQRGIITDERRNPATTARPLLNTSKPKPQPHIRPDELPDFYRALQTAHDLHPYARPLLLLAALTVPRPSALLSARWQDIDLTARLWHIPAADMKTKHPFTVPLSDWAVEILRELHTQTGDNIHLFPGIRPRRKPAPIPTTSASNSPTTPSDDWAMTAAPRQIQTHHARIPRPLHQHQPDRRKRHPHNRPRPWPHQPRRPPTRRLLKPAPLPDRRQLPPPRAARTRRMVRPPPPPSIRSRRPKHLQ
ncbi:TPA: integrase arm-type DNA-binding domain-containing protein [Neisseria gonorrhoeae]